MALYNYRSFPYQGIGFPSECPFFPMVEKSGTSELVTFNQAVVLNYKNTGLDGSVNPLSISGIDKFYTVGGNDKFYLELTTSGDFISKASILQGSPVPAIDTFFIKICEFDSNKKLSVIELRENIHWNNPELPEATYHGDILQWDTGVINAGVTGWVACGMSPNTGHMTYFDGEKWVGLYAPDTGMIQPILSHIGTMPKWISGSLLGGGSDTGSLHPWKITLTTPPSVAPPVTASWNVRGGTVYSNNGSFSIADQPITNNTGIIVLKIGRNASSRAVDSLAVQVLSDFVDGFEYQYVPLGVLNAPEVEQLTFEEIRIHELMIVENGEFKFAPFQLSSRKSYGTGVVPP